MGGGSSVAHVVQKSVLCARRETHKHLKITVNNAPSRLNEITIVQREAAGWGTASEKQDPTDAVGMSI